MKSLRLLIAFLMLAGSALAANATDPTGTWKFTAATPNGHEVETTLTLKWAANQLSGTIDNRAGRKEISHASFADDRVSFTVDRKLGRRLRKKTVTLRYSGVVAADTITGTIETTGRGGQPISIPWRAERVK